MPNFLHARRILLIIAGGVAAYKTLDLIRCLRKEGAEVHCIMTQSAQQFITPLSVSTLSGHPVRNDMFAIDDEDRLGHIRLARETDIVVVAPATANMLAKMAHGLADNLASAVLLATDKPILIAPSMNSHMWHHPATQTNLATLKARGVHQIGPASGSLACGEEGAGRLADIEDILAAITIIFSAHKPLAGRRALVTSGPTYEAIDPVRFIANRSSGKQGHAIAAALAALGADVTLISGPTALPAPEGVAVRPIETAQEMLQACLAVPGPVDIAICAAAVADWRPEQAADHKIKKDGLEAPPTLSLAENPDILTTLSNAGPARPKLVIGFAAETDDVLEKAMAKFQRKNCDWIVANQVGPDLGFGKDMNEVTLIRRDEHGALAHEAWPQQSKRDIAQALTTQIIRYFEGNTSP